MKGKEIFLRMTRAMDLNTEPIPGKPLVEIVDNSSVLIENHCGIVCYGSECIKVKTKSGLICVSGQKLLLDQISNEQIRIVGHIENIHFTAARIKGRGE